MPLNRVQRQLIDELTLKKKQSKKSTMSEKQMAAKQQLARELSEQRTAKQTIEDLLKKLEKTLQQYEYMLALERAILRKTHSSQGINNFQPSSEHS